MLRREGLGTLSKMTFNERNSVILTIGLWQLAIAWYKIRHAGGQAHYYSRTGTLKQRDLNQ